MRDEVQQELQLVDEQKDKVRNLVDGARDKMRDQFRDVFANMRDMSDEERQAKFGEIRTKMFRHTYAACRLQTLDHGAPVSIYTVSRELGHSSLAMVERTYAHLGTIRHRAEVVEYRTEQHADRLRPRLEKMGLL